MMLKVTLAAMLVSLLLLGVFAWRYASLLSLPGFILSCIVLLVWIGFAWAVNMGRIRTQMSPRLMKASSRWSSISISTGAGIAATIAAVLGIAWLFYAQQSPQGSLPQKFHWWGHALMLVGSFFGLLKLFVVLRPMPAEDTSHAVIDNANRRDRLLAEMQAAIASPWLAGFPAGTAGNRLRASLGWLVEELRLSLPQHGFALAESSVSHFLDELGRMMSFVKDLGERSERDDEAISEAERRVLEAINKSARVARRIAA